MEKYLFTNGMGGVREVESDIELQRLIDAPADAAKIRIWVFSTSEWISLEKFRQSKASFTKRPDVVIVPAGQTKKQLPVKFHLPAPVRKIIAGLVTAALVFLVYNFTRLRWTKAAALSVTAGRPANSPLVDADSIIQSIENLRGQKLDKITKTNLRIRNTWPELITARLTTERDTSREGSRYYNAEIMLDNSTGYNIDNALLKVTVWKTNRIVQSDEVRFENITYIQPVKRKIEGMLEGDSIAVDFTTIKAKAFNFCYSSDKNSNYGNYNDRWYCR